MTRNQMIKKGFEVLFGELDRLKAELETQKGIACRYTELYTTKMMECDAAIDRAVDAEGQATKLDAEVMAAYAEIKKLKEELAFANSERAGLLQANAKIDAENKAYKKLYGILPESEVTA